MRRIGSPSGRVEGREPGGSWVAPGLVVVVLTWAATWPLSQVALQSWPPLLLTGSRCLLSGVLLTVLTVARGLRPWGRHVARVAVFSGSLNVVGALVASTFAVHFLSGGLASLLFYLQPLFLVLLARHFHGEAVRASHWVAICVGFAGVAVVTLGAASQHVSLLGIAIGAGGGLSWAAGVVYLRSQDLKDAGHGQIISLVIGPQFLSGGAVILVAGCLLERWPAHGLEGVGLASMGGLTVASATGWLIYLVLLERGISMKRLGTWSFGIPLLANIAGFAFLHQHASAMLLAGGGIVMASIIAVELLEPARRRSHPPPSPG